MTGNLTKTRTTEEKSPVEVYRKTAEILYFRRTVLFWGPFWEAYRPC
jgi:hypothetical protein